MESAPWPLDGPIVHSRWRGLAAIGAIGEAVAHVPVIQMHLQEAPYIGAGFILLTIAGIFLGYLLVTGDTARVWAATAAVAALAIAGYVASRTVGLPEIHDDIGNWAEPLGVLALATEGLMLIAALAPLRACLRRSLRSAQR